ncbi:MAG: hypothetical protein QOC65_1543, partial [Sphingomonadales bacterium]|nr:hypothetical protein [Sphingomonadales bacterium]
MKRLASLYLPQLAIERLRRQERAERREGGSSSPAEAGEGDHTKCGGGVKGSACDNTPPPASAWSPSPSLRDGEELPLVLVIRTGNRQLVAAASAQARALGLAPVWPYPRRAPAGPAARSPTPIP